MSPQVFTLDMPHGLYEYYSPKSKNNRANVVAAKIASVCGALGEIPTVRYACILHSTATFMCHSGVSQLAHAVSVCGALPIVRYA